MLGVLEMRQISKSRTFPEFKVVSVGTRSE